MPTIFTHALLPLAAGVAVFAGWSGSEHSVSASRVRIAGAVRANLDKHLSAKDQTQAVNGGRHPLPKPEVFAAWLAKPNRVAY